jgi:DNA-binding GntR family transcriptional regulator
VKRSTPPLPYQGRVPRRSSGDEAALHIRRMIFDGELRPGERVPQDEVAAALGISRIPVREALIALEREGWVTIELHRGAFINALDEGTVRDNYELFGVTYGFAARRALDRGVGELLPRLKEIQTGLDATDDPAEFTTLAFAFHAAVVDAAQSPRLRVVLRAMSALVPGDFFVAVPDAVAGQRRGLTAIHRALKRGDAEAAADEYLKTMRRVGEHVVAVFRARGLFDTTGSAA